MTYKWCIVSYMHASGCIHLSGRHVLNHRKYCWLWCYTTITPCDLDYFNVLIVTRKLRTKNDVVSQNNKYSHLSIFSRPCAFQQDSGLMNGLRPCFSQPIGHEWKVKTNRVKNYYIPNFESFCNKDSFPGGCIPLYIRKKTIKPYGNNALGWWISYVRSVEVPIVSNMHIHTWV